jgi:hypothetical protein
MRNMQFVRMLVVIALIAITPALLFGQAVNFATIHGRVTDKSDAAVAGAQVKVTQVATGLVRTTTTTNDGNYTLPSLPVGEYKVEIAAKGFKDYRQTGITLTVGSSAAIDAALEVGAISETVEVHADAAMVETHENSITTLIDNNRIMEMPLNGRNAPDLVMLAGTASNASLTTSQDILSTKNYGNGSSGASQTISVAGGQQNSNNYLLDGGDNNDSFSNVNAPLPMPDAIQEFSVQTSGLSARYGKQAGAVINVITKSGTNNYHGSGFEFIRNPYLNAHHVLFTPPAAGFRDDTIKRNMFGGTFGGPIKKDKLLFFLGFQERRDSSAGTSSTTVPTPAMMLGDWSACPKAWKAPFTSYFVGNKIDLVAHPFDTAAVKLLNYIPRATSDPCGKITYSTATIVNEDQGVAKLDWNISAKQQAFARYFATDYRSPVAFDASNIMTQNTSSQFSRYQTLVLGDTYSLNSGIVNSAHATVKRLAINRAPSGDMINNNDLGINTVSPIPNGMNISISSYFSVGGGSSMPGHFINNMYQFSDDVDIIRGKHQISFGANWMKMQLNYLSTFQSNGNFTFGGSTSGDNLVDFLYGMPSNFVQGNPEWENWRMDYFGTYIQDNYKMRPNLTINAGIRWEPYMPSADTAHRGSHIDVNAFLANQHSTVFPNAPAGLSYCGDAGTPCAFQDRKWKQLAPRFGVIWDPRNKGKETIRAGYGIFFDSPEMYYFDRYADNSPYGSGLSFSPTSFINPYGSTPQAWPTPFPQPGSSAGIFPIAGVYINNNFNTKPMYVQNWNLSLEKQFGADWSVSATYLGSKTTHLWSAYEANPALNVLVPASAVTDLPNNGCVANAAPSTKNFNCRRLLYLENPSQGKYFSNVTSLWDGGNSLYNAMLLTAKHRFNNNFTLMTNYTWSHCLSDEDFTGELTNSRPSMTTTPWAINPSTGHTADYGNCGFDVRHQFNSSLVINSPKQQGTLGMFLNNWQLAPMVTYRSGTPFNLTTGADTALVGATTSTRDRPNQIGDPYQGTCTVSGVTYAVGDRHCYFNPNAFSIPATITAAAYNGTLVYGPYGNVARDSLYGPGAFNFNASVSRKLKITEGKELSLRLDLFNVLNHPVLGNPNANVASSNASRGQITSQIGDGRTFQGAVKFTF